MRSSLVCAGSFYWLRRRFKSARLKTHSEAHMAKKKKKVARGKKLPSVKTLRKDIIITAHI